MSVRVGIGGWTFEPWRGPFYPPKWPIKRELEYASRRLTAIEVNGTYYSGFKPETFAKWRDETPDGFVFTLKASRFCTNRKVLAEAGPSVEKFVHQGIVELGEKLGPILWQFMATKRFERDDFARFLDLLPRAVDGVPLRHAVQVRHESFAVPEYIALLRAAGVANVFAQSDDYPAIADVSGDVVYARIETASDAHDHGYTGAELDRWAATAQAWARGDTPAGLPTVAEPAPAQPRDTFLFFIGGDKVRNPGAARETLVRLGVALPD